MNPRPASHTAAAIPRRRRPAGRRAGRRRPRRLGPQRQRQRPRRGALPRRRPARAAAGHHAARRATASLPAGAVALPQTFRLGGENVRYTTDGSDPTAASMAHTAGISVTSALTIKAVAIDAAANVSPVATFSYTEKPVVRVIQPTPDPVVVERPVAVVTQVVREVVRGVPAPAVPRAAAPGIDKVAATRRVALVRARKGVAVTASTKAAFIRIIASRGARVTAARKPGTGYALRFTAKRAGTYKVTIAVPQASAKVVTIHVRRRRPHGRLPRLTRPPGARHRCARSRTRSAR